MKLIYGSVEKILGGEISKKEKRAAEREAGRLLLGLLLERYIPSASLSDVAAGEHGKPYLPTAPSVDFNITHSNGFVACAISVGRGKIGIDAEPSDGSIPKARQLEFAKRFFSRDELCSLESGRFTFAQLWTRKEARLKMTGEGFSSGAFSSLPPSNESGIFFTTLSLDGFTVTVCSESDAEIEVLRYVDGE